MKQIIVSGFGGQGVLSLGLMLSYAAMKEDLHTSFLPSYGPEMRGGTANCSVVISSQQVASPIIDHPDIVVAMNEPSLTKFAPHVAQGGYIFVDSESTAKAYLQRADVVGVPLAKLCGGNNRGHNLVLLGAILPFTGLTLAAVEDAVKNVFKNKPQFLQANLACLHAGYDYIQTVKR